MKNVKCVFNAQMHGTTLEPIPQLVVICVHESYYWISLRIRRSNCFPGSERYFAYTNESTETDIFR
jgi:hypothetical protein